MSLINTSTPHFLEGWLRLGDFARDEVKKHPRTVKRWTKKPNGLPYAVLGNEVMIHVPTARDWLLGKLRHPNQRRNSKVAA